MMARITGARPSIGHSLPMKALPEDIHQLWDELSDFGALAIEDAARHCMQRICDWIGADNAFWIGGVRMLKGAEACKDPLYGWRISVVDMLHANADVSRRAQKGMKDTRSDDPSMSTRAIVSLAGQFRVHSLYSLQDAGMLDLDAFKKTAHYDCFYRSPDVHDRIWAVFPINEDVESYFCFDSYRPSHRFGAEDMELVARALRGIKWFHRQMLLSHGLYISDVKLTRSERQVLQGLLTGASEKEIADSLHRTPGTINQYAARLYRKFGVSSRPTLMSLWLSGIPQCKDRK